MLLDQSKPYAHIFLNEENGTPDDISKRGCVALARRGAEVWNAWRKDFPVQGGRLNAGYGVISRFRNGANFENIEFDRPVDFSRFDFGADANFEGVRFLKDVKFSMAKFGERARFSWSKFSSDAVFDACLFEHDANFTCADFKALAYFSYSRFGDEVDFSGAKFGAQTTFRNIVFGKKLCFEFAQFSGWPADFVAGSRDEFVGVFDVDEAANIEKWVSERGLSYGCIRDGAFSGANFAQGVDFSGINFEGKTRFSKTLVQGTSLLFEHDQNGQIVFEGDRAKILEKFEKTRDQPTVFGSPPIFHGCKFGQDTSFDGSKFPSPSGFEGSIRAYRTLKLLCSQQQAVKEEQKFFRLEMAEEELASKFPVRCLHWIYRVTSDYGFSVWRPLTFYVAISLLFSSLYGYFAGFEFCFFTNIECSVDDDWIEFSLLNSVPLPGVEKYSENLRSSVFSQGQGSLGITVLTILHKIFALLSLFLCGLALRNTFKMK